MTSAPPALHLSMHAAPADAASWRLTPRAIAVRLFFTCWLIYALHAATNTVREIYPALAIGDHLSFRLDEYAGLHPDLFEMKGRGWYINSNPGASMLGAVPYALFRPVIDRIVSRVNRGRAASGQRPPEYASPWPMARAFYEQAWRRGLDVKFGLAALLMQVLCMAPVSAMGVVAMFYLLRRLFHSDRAALWLGLLYGFGTPVFFRTGYLNQNLLLAHFAFLGFLALWTGRRGCHFLAGLAGGAAVLLDYSGIVLLMGLFVYGMLKRAGLRRALWYALGALGPLALLWYYQWSCFGNPFLPAQHWMARVAYIDIGYQGVAWPQPDLLFLNAFDYRFGLFTTAPVLLLALVAPFRNRILPSLEMWFLLLLPAALWLFCGSVSYTRLQYNTGFRHMVPAVPFLFVAVALVLARLPRRTAYFVAVLAIAQAWCMAMYRDVERGFGVLDPVIRVVVGGFTLPVLTVLSRMPGQFGEYVSGGVSALPAFLLVGAVLYGVWSARPQDHAR